MIIVRAKVIEMLQGGNMTINFTAIAITAIICITLIAISRDGRK